MSALEHTLSTPTTSERVTVRFEMLFVEVEPSSKHQLSSERVAVRLELGL